MAEINGISLKNVKHFKDHEGCMIAQGDVYYKGKKLGFWTEDSWGGPDSYDFDETVLDEEVKKYAASDYVEDKYRSIINLDILLANLLALIDDEKGYKKGVKKGYSKYVLADDGFHVFGFYTNEEDPKKGSFYTEFIKNCRKTFFKDWEPDGIKVYTSLDDFKLTC